MGAVKRQVQHWNEEASETCCDCNCNDWETFTDGSNLEEATEAIITDYILLYEDMIIPKTTVNLFLQTKCI